MSKIARRKRALAIRARAAIAAGGRPTAAEAAQLGFLEELEARSPQLKKDIARQVATKEKEIRLGPRRLGGAADPVTGKPFVPPKKEEPRKPKLTKQQISRARSLTEEAQRKEFGRVVVRQKRAEEFGVTPSELPPLKPIEAPTPSPPLPPKERFNIFRKSAEGFLFARQKLSVAERKLIERRAKPGTFTGQALGLVRAGKFAAGTAAEFEVGLAEKPIKTLAVAGTFATLPGTTAAAKFAVARVAPRFVRGAQKVITPKITEAGKLGLTGAFGAVKGQQLLTAETGREREKIVGETISTEVLPALAGGVVGQRFAVKPQFRAGFELELSTLPKRRREQFRELLKVRTQVIKEPVKPRDIDFLEVEAVQREKKVASELQRFFVERRRDVIITGSIAQRAQTPGDVKQLKRPGDIDIALRPGAERVPRQLFQRLKRTGVSGLEFTQGKIFLRGQKLVEFKPVEAPPGQRSLRATLATVQPTLQPFEAAITKTPRGIPITRLEPQLGRKVFGAFEKQRGVRAFRASKDIPAFTATAEAILKQQKERAAASVFFPKLKVQRIEKFEQRLGLKKPKRKFGLEEEEEIIIPPRVKSPIRGKQKPLFKSIDSQLKKVAKPSRFPLVSAPSRTPIVGVPSITPPTTVPSAPPFISPPSAPPFISPPSAPPFISPPSAPPFISPPSAPPVVPSIITRAPAFIRRRTGRIVEEPIPPLLIPEKDTRKRKKVKRKIGVIEPGTGTFAPSLIGRERFRQFGETVKVAPRFADAGIRPVVKGTFKGSRRALGGLL